MVWNCNGIFKSAGCIADNFIRLCLLTTEMTGKGNPGNIAQKIH